MRIATTVCLLLIAVGLIIAVFWDSINPFKKEVVRPEIPAILPHEVTAITVDSEFGKARLERKAGIWEVTQPYQDRADQELVNTILAGAEKIQENSYLSAEEIQKEGKGLAAFGLGDSKPLKISFSRTGGEIASFLLGDEAALTDSIYLQLADQPETGVFIANSNVRPLVEQPAEAFLDKHVLRINPGALVNLEFQRGDTTIELQRKDPMTPWLIVKPMEVRADVERTQNLITIYATFPVANVVPAAQAEVVLNKLPSDVQRIRFTESDGAQGTREPIELTLIPSGEEGFAYAKVSNRPQMYKVPVEALEVAPEKASLIRDRLLIRVNSADVETLVLNRPDTSPLAIQQVGNTWFFAAAEENSLGEMVNQDKGEELFNLLKTTNVYSYVSDSATDHTKYGLDQPILTVTFKGNDLGAKHQEEITMKIGRVAEHVKEVFVNFEGEPFVYAVESSFYHTLSALADRVKWKKLDLFNVDLQAIREIELTNRGGKTFQIEYDLMNPDPSEKKAKIMSDELDITPEVDPSRPLQLAFAVSNLNAHAWLADSTQALEALQTPSLIVEVRSVTSGEGGAAEVEKIDQVSLVSTNEASGAVQFYYGVKEGENQVFLLTREVYDLLTGHNLISQ